MTLETAVESYTRRVQFKRLQIEAADLTDSDTQQTIDFETVMPTPSFRLGAFVQVDTAFSATAIAATAAAVTSDNAAPYVMAAGDTLVIDTDDGGNETCTWDAAAATVEDTTTYAVTDQDTLTEVVIIDGGNPQTVLFAGVTTSAVHVATQMNAQLTGCSVSGATGQVIITSDTKGTDSSVSITEDGTGGLTWDTPVAGSGDVATIVATTAAEVLAVINADTTGLTATTAVGGESTLTSDSTGAASEIDVISGNAAAILGFAVEAVVGTAAVAEGTATIDVGISGGDTDAMLDAADVSTATGQVSIPQGVAPLGCDGGETISVIVDTTNQNCDTFVAGDMTVVIPYIDLTGQI